MKSNEVLGYTEIVHVGNYTVGKRAGSKSFTRYRAYGYEWHGDQDASKERAHHEVCGRGDTAGEAIDKMIAMAIVSGRKSEYAHNMQNISGLDADSAEVLRLELHEAIAEAADD